MARKQIKKDIIKNFYIKEVKDRHRGEYVKSITLKIGFLSQKILKVSSAIRSRDLYASARSFMHIKEKREKTLEEIIIPNAYRLFSFPDFIYKNKRRKEDKRGDILLIKKLDPEKLLIAIFEINTKDKHRGYHLVTTFIARPSYLKRRTKIWEKH